jgi:hypothetical protein
MVPTSVGQKIVRYNADGGTRTHDLMLRRHALYPLSYVSMSTLYHACQREDYKKHYIFSLLRTKKAGRQYQSHRFDSCRGHCPHYSD